MSNSPIDTPQEANFEERINHLSDRRNYFNRYRNLFVGPGFHILTWKMDPVYETQKPVLPYQQGDRLLRFFYSIARL